MTDPALINKFHSAIRWGKTIPELEAVITENSIPPTIFEDSDPQNGNRAIHLAAQNGHLAIVMWLITDKGVEVNAQNAKGQTALHMSTAYDFYDQSKFLLINGAQKGLKNGEGNEAITGIDGDKTGSNAWDSPVNVLKAARTSDDMERAFKVIEVAIVDAPEILDKAAIISAGMAKKNDVDVKKFWDHKKFMELAKKIP